MSNKLKSFQQIEEAMKNPKNWFPTHKLSYMVSVKLPEYGLEVENILENAHYTIDEKKEFLIRGTVGETWVIDEAKLKKTYTFEDGTPFSKDKFIKRAEGNPRVYQKLKTISNEDATTNFAFKLPSDAIDFPVKTSWGDTLYANSTTSPHGKGDLIVCAIDENGQPNLNDIWIVNGLVFETTYDLSKYIEPTYREDK